MRLKIIITKYKKNPFCNAKTILLSVRCMLTKGFSLNKCGIFNLHANFVSTYYESVCIINSRISFMNDMIVYATVTSATIYTHTEKRMLVIHQT